MLQNSGTQQSSFLSSKITSHSLSKASRAVSSYSNFPHQTQSELVEKTPGGVFRVSGEVLSADVFSPINRGECRTVRIGFLASGDLCSKSATRLRAAGERLSAKKSGFSSHGSFTNLAIKLIISLCRVIGILHAKNSLYFHAL